MNDLSAEAVSLKIQEIITKITGVTEQIRPDARLVEDLGFESMEDVEVLQALEEEYDITITQNDVDSLYTFHHLLLMILRKLKEKRL